MNLTIYVIIYDVRIDDVLSFLNTADIKIKDLLNISYLSINNLI